MDKEQVKTIKTLIAKDKIEKALDLLLKYFDENQIENELLLNSARFNELKSITRKGIISTEAGIIEKNKIRLSILEILEEIEIAERNPGLLDRRSTGRNNIVVSVIVGIVLIILLYFCFGRKTIIGIQGDNNDDNKIEISE